MGYFKQKLSGLRKRYKSAKYGIFYFKDSTFILQERLCINGRRKKFKFTNTSDAELAYEFNEICINDCYHLAELKKILPAAGIIVDIGANQGLFAIAARQHFSRASITCYEPNRNLESILSHNTNLLNVQVFYEAVCLADCTLTLNPGKSDLHTQIRLAAKGDVIGTRFSKVFERAGDHIDILKVDCEGTEWELFEDSTSWMKVNAVTMEYHLWANTRKNVGDVINRLTYFGLTIISDKRLSNEFGLITAVRITRENNIH